jgi:hypothetical protein
MKELINFASQPIIAFPLVMGFFFFVMKNARMLFATKKFGVISGIIAVSFFCWAFQDPYFNAIILWPDNIPIVILLVTVGFFTWFSLYKAVQNDIRMERGEQPIEGTPENREKVWSWPNLVYTELFAIIAGTVFLIAWAIIFKAPLEEPANPTWAPNPAKAPWYFLGLQEMLVYFDPWMAGVVLPGLILVGLISLPYIDKNPKGNGYYSFQDRKFAMVGFLYGWLVLWVFLIIVGTFLRGPNWTFYGPFEFWDFHKVVAESNINLSEILWVKLLGQSMPQNIFVREILGVIFVGAYLVVPTLLLEKYLGKTMKAKMGMIRYYLLIFLILGMASLPLKMFLRWSLNLKYIVAMPEFELNL